MKNYFSSLAYALTVTFVISMALLLTQTKVSADMEQTNMGLQYAAVSKPSSGPVKSQDQDINSTSAELEEINSILKSTSRKIALLEADVKEQPSIPQVTITKPVASGPNVQKKSPVAQTDEDLRKQTLEEISPSVNIDNEYKNAKNIYTDRGTPAIFAYETPLVYQTQAQVIKSVISDEVLRKRIDLDFDETALGDIIQTISKIAGINIVLDPALKGNKFDLHLASVTVQEALLLIADSFKLGFKRVGDSLYATLHQDLLTQSQTSRVFKLKNITVNQARELLGDMGKKIQSSPDLNSLIAVGQPEEIEKIEKAIIRLDVPQPQVVMEAKILEITRDGLRDLGIDWSETATVGFQEKNRPATFSNIETAGDEAYKFYSLARNPVQFSATLRILERQNKAKVLTSPSVSTLNGKESKIFVGDRIPYTITNATGGVAVTEVQWVEPGIRLTITPSIIGDDFVVIKVQPEVSFIYDYRGPNNEYPHIKTREATAYVRIKNNEPFVLGGLLSQADKKNLYKVPLLGNVPWLGNLFSRQKKEVIDEELIIIITPTIYYGNLK